MGRYRRPDSGRAGRGRQGSGSGNVWGPTRASRSTDRPGPPREANAAVSRRPNAPVFAAFPTRTLSPPTGNEGDYRSRHCDRTTTTPGPRPGRDRAGRRRKERYRRPDSGRAGRGRQGSGSGNVWGPTRASRSTDRPGPPREANAAVSRRPNAPVFAAFPTRTLSPPTGNEANHRSRHNLPKVRREGDSPRWTAGAHLPTTRRPPGTRPAADEEPGAD